MKIERYDLTLLAFTIAICCMIGAVAYHHTLKGTMLTLLMFAMFWVVIDEVQLQKAKEDIKKLEGIYK